MVSDNGKHYIEQVRNNSSVGQRHFDIPSSWGPANGICIIIRHLVFAPHRCVLHHTWKEGHLSPAVLLV